MTHFEDIIENFDNEVYITISTRELTLQLLPFFQLPARKIANLYNEKQNQRKFIKEIYHIISVAMANPSEFKQTVYDTGITYSGLVEFLNTWIQVSNMINKFETGEIDSDGNPTAKTTVSNVDILQNIIFSKLSKGEDVKTKMLIRYLAENIKELAKQYNEENPNDIIPSVTINIPIGREVDDEY